MLNLNLPKVGAPVKILARKECSMPGNPIHLTDSEITAILRNVL